LREKKHRHPPIVHNMRNDSSSDLGGRWKTPTAGRDCEVHKYCVVGKVKKKIAAVAFLVPSVCGSLSTVLAVAVHTHARAPIVIYYYYY
jgi:hypothetical protein